jgi:hypothetical protein
VLNKIIAALATRYSTTVAVIRKHVAVDQIEEWGKVRRIDGGDTMNASALMSSTEDRRDATFVRVSAPYVSRHTCTDISSIQYETLVDTNSRVRRRAPNFELKTFFGQLEHIFLVRISTAMALGLTEGAEVLLAAVRNCNILSSNDLDMHYYQDFGCLDVVDVTCLQCLVARAPVEKTWVIFDRSGTLSRAVVADNLVE